MLESEEKYRKILRKELVSLEWAVGHQAHHLDAGLCPRCGNFGHFDIDGLGFSSEAGNSIYYSTVFNEWRCRICDFRMCA